MLIKNITAKGTVIRIGDAEIHVLDITNRSVRLGIEAPRTSKIQTQDGPETYMRDDLDKPVLPPIYRKSRRDVDPSGL